MGSGLIFSAWQIEVVKPNTSVLLGIALKFPRSILSICRTETRVFSDSFSSVHRFDKRAFLRRRPNSTSGRTSPLSSCVVMSPPKTFDTRSWRLNQVGRNAFFGVFCVTIRPRKARPRRLPLPRRYRSPTRFAHFEQTFRESARWIVPLIGHLLNISI